MQLRNDVSGRDLEFLRQALRQLERLRRLTPQKGSGLEDLVIISGRKKFFYRDGEMYLPGDVLRWESDSELRRQIYGVLAAHRLGVNYPAGSAGLPPWMVAGLDSGIMSAETAGQYIAGNSSYALLSSICQDETSLPDFGAMCRLDFAGIAVADDFAAEQARMLLEIFARNDRLRELVFGVLAGKRGDFWLDWYSSPEEAQRYLQRDAAPLLFDRFNPMPTAAALKKIAGLEQFFVPEADAEGKLTGNILEGDVTVFCTQLAVKRADRNSLRRAAAAQWRQFGSRLSIDGRELCQQIANALLRAGEDDEVPEIFQTAVTALKKNLLKQQQLDAFLTRTLDRMIPPMLRLRMLLRAVDNDETALSDRQRDFFNRTLDIYLR